MCQGACLKQLEGLLVGISGNGMRVEAVRVHPLIELPQLPLQVWLRLLCKCGKKSPSRCCSIVIVKRVTESTSHDKLPMQSIRLSPSISSERINPSAAQIPVGSALVRSKSTLVGFKVSNSLRAVLEPRHLGMPKPKTLHRASYVSNDALPDLRIVFKRHNVPRRIKIHWMYSFRKARRYA